MTKFLQALTYAAFYLVSLLPYRALYVLADVLHVVVYDVARYRVKVVSKEGEEYTITNYGSSVHDFNIGGGIFGEESTNTHSIWNVVGNIQEVFLTLASGEEYVNVRIGNSGAYVRISVAKVQI